MSSDINFSKQDNNQNLTGIKTCEVNLKKYKKMKIYYLYILSDKKHEKLRIDITDNIISTIKQLRDNLSSVSKNNDEE